MSISNWTEAFFNLLFPNSCLFCGNPIWGQPPNLCMDCFNSLNKIYPAYFDLYLSKIENRKIDRILIAFAYDTVLQELFERMKYNGEREISVLLGRLAADALGEYISQNSVFIPVPLHRKKLRQRGYNQAELIACSIAKSAGGLQLNCAYRTKNTVTQTRLNKSERVKNVSGAFRIQEKYFETLNKSREIILVDDVVTTGATLNELALSIKEKFPRITITALAVATPLVKDIY